MSTAYAGSRCLSNPSSARSRICMTSDRTYIRHVLRLCQGPRSFKFTCRRFFSGPRPRNRASRSMEGRNRNNRRLTRKRQVWRRGGGDRQVWPREARMNPSRHSIRYIGHDPPERGSGRGPLEACYITPAAVPGFERRLWMRHQTPRLAPRNREPVRHDAATLRSSASHPASGASTRRAGPDEPCEPHARGRRGRLPSVPDHYRHRLARREGFQ